MTHRETDAPVLVAGAHRVIRTIDPTEGPFAGVLVAQANALAVRVDACALEGWAGWRFAGAEHVAGPVDLIRRPDGHDVLLPWCAERVAVFLARRVTAGVRLSSGECATLVASLLRGIDELGADATTAGSWWLTDDGRPVLVIGDGEGAHTEALQLITRLIDDCGDKALRRALGAVQDDLRGALGQPRISRRLLEKREQELFSIAAPRALDREVYPPERAQNLARVRPADLGIAPARRARRDSAPRAQRMPRLLGRATAVREALRAAVASGSALVRLRHGSAAVKVQRGGTADAPPSRSGRRRSLIVAGIAAGVVLVAGLFWPGGATGESDRPKGSATAPTTRDDAPEMAVPLAGAPSAPATRSPVVPRSSTDDPAVAASALLAMIDACVRGNDPVCANAVAAGSAGVLATLKGVSAGDQHPEVVDVYGDVAVVRVAGMLERMLVLIRVDKKWLVRDVYDVADQPE